jgi:hypothetical protein
LTLANKHKRHLFTVFDLRKAGGFSAFPERRC